MSPQVVLAVIAAIVATFLYYLGAEFHPDGVLATLQDVLQVLYVVPFLFAVVLSGNVHAPSAGPVFVGLFIEAYVLLIAIFWLMKKARRRENRPQL